MIIIVPLTGMEILARVLFLESSYNVNPLSEFEYDEILGWKGIPGYKGKSPLFRVDIQINQYGFRDKDWGKAIARAKRRHLTKLLFLGDSVTYGYEIEAHERVTEQLEKLNMCHGREVVTFNAGIPAFGTGQEYKTFEILMPVIEPDMVVLLYSSNDIGDSALPYCWGDPKYRVYRPFYDVEGNLMLNKRVPRRFSLLVRGTLLDHLRLKFFVDRFQSLLDDIRYSSLEVSENRRIEIENPIKDQVGFRRHVWDMGCATTHPFFRDIYDKNKVRNFNLLKKINIICREKGIRFLVVTYFDGHPDPAHPNQEMMTFLKKNKIEFVNRSTNNNFGPWSYVYYDGHPNFLTNYVAAINLYNALEKNRIPLDFSASDWYERLSSEIDFSKGRFHKYLFGRNWDKKREYCLGRVGRWLRGPAQVLLRNALLFQNGQIQMEGFSPDGNNLITLSDREDHILDKGDIPKRGTFQVNFQFRKIAQKRLLFLKVNPQQSVLVYHIRVIEEVNEQINPLFSSLF